VTKDDFERALEEVRPAFGSESDALNDALRLGISDYGVKFTDMVSTGRLFVEQVASSDKTPLMGVLLEGERETGKTALAALLAKESGYPFIKMITADMLLGYPEGRKCDKITRVFEDAHKSPRSIIILDNLERLLSYVPIGPRFSNEVLQTLLVLLRKTPPKGRKLLVIGTTSSLGILGSMDLAGAFSVSVRVPTLASAEIVEVFRQLDCFIPAEIENCAAIFTGGVGIKRLMIVVEMARQEAARAGQTKIGIEAMANCATAIGLLG